MQGSDVPTEQGDIVQGSETPAEKPAEKPAMGAERADAERNENDGPHNSPDCGLRMGQSGL